MRSKEAYNNFYLTPKELDQHIHMLRMRKKQVVDKIRIIGEEKLGKQRVDKMDDEVCLISELNI